MFAGTFADNLERDMTPTLFERLDAIAPRVTGDEYGVMLEMALQLYETPDEFAAVLDEQLAIVERRILDDVLTGKRSRG